MQLPKRHVHFERVDSACDIPHPPPQSLDPIRGVAAAGGRDRSCESAREGGPKPPRPPQIQAGWNRLGIYSRERTAALTSAKPQKKSPRREPRAF